MREQVRVQMKSTELIKLGALLPQIGNSSAGTLRPLYLRAVSDFEDDEDIEEILRAARERHNNGELNIDDDAPISRGEDGIWVGAWVFLPTEESKNQSSARRLTWLPMFGSLARKTGQLLRSIWAKVLSWFRLT